MWVVRVRICRRLRSLGIDSKESIPPAYVARRTGTITIFVLPLRQATYAGESYSLESIPGLLKRLRIRALMTYVGRLCWDESKSLTGYRNTL